MKEANTIDRPLDWPVDGPIDLLQHDLPHASSLTEWWYVHSYFDTPDKRKLSLFAAFFRVAVGVDEESKETKWAHSLTWAISDADKEFYYADSLVDRRSPELGLARLDRAEDQGVKGATRDPRIRRAAREVLEKGQVPYPDHMFEAEPFVSQKRLELDFDGNRFEKLDDGSYRLELWHEYYKVGATLVLKPQKAPVRHGQDGVVHGIDGADMFYYFIPRCELTGHVVMNGSKMPVLNGSAWYDHEFGGHHHEDESGNDDVAWNWVAVQLSDGRELTAYEMLDLERPDEALGKRLLLIEADGTRKEFLDLHFEPTAFWRSTRTFNSYPVAWTLVSKEAGLHATIRASFDDQEFVTLISKPAFWEGRCEFEGQLQGQEISGNAYLERSGHLEVEDLESFFRSVGVKVRESVANLLPYDPTYEEVRRLIASEERDHYMEGVDLQQFVRTGVTPVREITDRGGKGWRSYAALACCDVVGGDSRDFVHWLAMPELMHVGSLIVDDVQDRSEIRRGGPSCHQVHGDALAINVGTSCYFMGQHLLHSSKVSDRQKVRLYDLYFEALRAGHAGQAADIEGLWSYVPKAVETGDIEELDARVLAIHRLKTAAPAGALARMGALVGGGTELQIEGLGRYFESVGLAFQVVDDVLNLRGFERGLKQRGEDLAQGKVTLPVVRALPKMSLKERQTFMATLEGQPQDQKVIDGMIDTLEACGALEECSQAAKDMIEEAWHRLDPLLEPSVVKLMLRAFGWFVLERHY